jgi:hypothetical protein
LYQGLSQSKACAEAQMKRLLVQHGLFQKLVTLG